MLKGKNIVMGVSGGIAVYKAVDVVSRLKKLGANIDIIMTKAATEFVTPLTFQSLSQNHVTVDMFTEPQNWEIEHIALASKADLFLVAPATANIIGKIANGIADDMLSTTIMATKAKVVFAPAMNTNMYNNPIFKNNLESLKSYGYKFIKPEIGRLACGDYGEGKMAEPSDIVEHVVSSFAKKDFLGKRIVVTAGPTIAPLDPVRYLTNHSSGKMGYAIANEASNRGAEVTLISGPTSLQPPAGVNTIRVNTTIEMFEEIEKLFDECDVVIKAAAPLDYRPKTVSVHKIKKSDENMNVELIKNPDIALHFGKCKKKQIIVGFAAETQNVIDNARSKLEKKNFDFIVVNDVSKEDAGFKSDTNIVSILDRYGNQDNFPLMKKEELAKIIIDKVNNILK